MPRRGKLLKAKILVGDELEITELENDKGVIEAQLPRRNQIRRPAVANLDQLMVIMQPSHRIRTAFSSIRCS